MTEVTLFAAALKLQARERGEFLSKACGEDLPLRRRADGHVSVYDLVAGRVLHRLPVGFTPYHVAFHPRDGQLAVAGSNAVRIFETDSGPELSPLNHENPAAMSHRVS